MPSIALLAHPCTSQTALLPLLSSLITASAASELVVPHIEPSVAVACALMCAPQNGSVQDGQRVGRKSIVWQYGCEQGWPMLSRDMSVRKAKKVECGIGKGKVRWHERGFHIYVCTTDTLSTRKSEWVLTHGSAAM